MSKEQQQLLYEIVKWRINAFYNDMKDHWNASDSAIADKCSANIFKLENQYKELYGDLPDWQSIDDIFNARDELKKIVEG